MSSLIGHLLRKDIRHLRGILIVWVVLILSQAALIGSGIGASADNMATQVAFQILSFVLPALKALVAVVMIPLLVHDEPLVGSTAFWFTRPLSRKTVLASKSVFIGIILILVPLAAELAIFIGNGVLTQHVLIAIPEILIALLSTAVQVSILAVLTPNFARFAIVGVIAFVALMLVSVGITLARLFLGGPMSWMEMDMTLMQSRELVGSAVIIVAGIFVIVNQFLTRATARSIVVAVVGLAAMLVAQNLWPIDFLKSPRTEPDKEVVDCEKIRVELDEGSVTFSDSFSMRSSDRQTKNIQGRLTVAGLDERFFAQPAEIQSRFELPGGTVISSTNKSGFMGSMRGVQRDALQALFGEVVVVNASRFSYSLEDLLTVSQEVFHEQGRTAGTLTADVDLAVRSYRIVAELPLERDARYDSGSEQVVVARILQEPPGCTVMLRESKVNLMLAGSGERRKKAGRRSVRMTRGDVMYVLRNKARREAILPKDNVDAFSGMQEGQRLQVRPVRLVYEPEAHGGGFEIDEEWLKEADLVRVEMVDHGNCRRTLRVEDFMLASGKKNRMFSEQRRETPDEEALAKITLPEEPTRSDVEKYVKAIMDVSANQSRKSSKDPQIEMLVAVGPDFVDVLLEQRESDTYYINAALRRLAGPEHKEMILKALPGNRSLVSVVVQQGWQDDARDILVGELKKRPDNLPTDWIKAVATFEDPSTYDELKHYLQRSSNRKATYDAVKNLPGIDLKESVAVAWKLSKYGNNYERNNMIPIALQYGHMDALAAAASELKEGSYYAQEIEKAVKAMTPFAGKRDEFPSWYREHRNQLYFDEDAGVFKLKSDL